MFPRPWRISITLKLLAWCIALLAVTYATSTLLVARTEEAVDGSAQLMRVNHELDVAIVRLVRQLEQMEGHRKTYEYLNGDEIYLEYVIDDLLEFRRLLEETMVSFPWLREDWGPLTEEYAITLKKGGDPVRLLGPGRTVALWLDILERTRLDNQERMQLRLKELRAGARQAAETGRLGLLMAIGIGLGGSLLLAWRLNSSLRELMRGIHDFGRFARTTPVVVKSRDELGELAGAFNRLTARLEREERMRSEFIAMLSHEIRTPLTSIRESVELVADGTLGGVVEEQKQFLDIARHESDRLAALLTRLMKVSSLEAGELEVELRAEDPAALVREALERIAPVARAVSIALVPGIPEGLPPVLADAGHVGQVLLNLLGNAIKFSPPGSEVRLDVTAGEGEVVFTVTDQGPGIPEEDREFVFQKYYRGDDAKKSVDGAGLGLSICRIIAEAHGGLIRIESGPGRGSRFLFSLKTA
ncbi:MAG: HAMP domain-containing histidine kinase [Proteobacteria bacterium]|nr:HAMP domain-containing histidine kinase [Pseudomonadota bacterium]